MFNSATRRLPRVTTIKRTMEINNPEESSAVGSNLEPSSWRNYEMAQKTFLHDNLPTKFFFYQAMQTKLKCFNCRKSLSVGPFFYEKEQPKNKVCGRCIRDPTSAVYAREMLQDHLYEKLLQFFQFQCTCNKILLASQVKEHEINCYPKHKDRRRRPKSHPPIDWRNRNTFCIYVVRSDVDKLSETLSCDLCNKPLSVFPVISNSKRFICGRCEQPESGEWTKQMIYFYAERCIKFPCNYANCTSMQRVDKIVEHHKNCRWAVMRCPLNCGLLYPVAEMSIHIRRIHLHESVDRIEVKQQTSLFQIEGEPYIVSVTDADSKRQIYSCAVFGLDEKEYENLRMEAVDNDSGSVTLKSPVKIARLEQRLFYSRLFNLTVQIETNSYIRLVRVADTVGGLELDEESDQRFMCPVCYCYMTRLIFKCVNGHPICDKCKMLIDKSCPMCRGVLPANDRHSDLENEATKFKFPCSLQERNNCNVKLTPELLAKHEVRCKWREELRSGCCLVRTCSLVLDSDQYNDLFNHCAQQHFDSVMYTGSKEIYKWSTEADASPPPCESLLFFDGEVFFVTFHYSERNGLVIQVSYRKPRSWTVPNFKRYKLTLDLKNHKMATSIAWSGTVSMSSLPWTLRWNSEGIESMVSVGPTFNWIEYRVKLEFERSKVQLLTLESFHGNIRLDSTRRRG